MSSSSFRPSHRPGTADDDCRGPGAGNNRVQSSRNLHGLMQEEGSAERPAKSATAIPSEPELRAQVCCAVPAPVARSRNERTAGASCRSHPHRCARPFGNQLCSGAIGDVAPGRNVSQFHDCILWIKCRLKSADLAAKKSQGQSISRSQRRGIYGAT